MTDKIKLRLTDFRYHELHASFEGIREWIEDDRCTDEERKALKEMLHAIDNCERKRKHYVMHITLEGLKALEGEMENICERLSWTEGYFTFAEWRSMDVLWKAIRKKIKDNTPV